MSEQQGYQDQGSLDQPQQGTQGEYTTPGVVAPEDQTDEPVAQQDVVPQVPGGGAVPTPGEGEAQLPDGSIVPDTEATPAAIQEAQNTPAPAQPAPGGGAGGAGGAEPTPA